MWGQMGGRLGTSADMQASWHESTVHVQRLFPHKQRGRWLWHHYHEATVVLLTYINRRIKKLPHEPQGFISFSQSVLVWVLGGKATDSLFWLSQCLSWCRTIKHTGKCLSLVPPICMYPRFAWAPYVSIFRVACVIAGWLITLCSSTLVSEKQGSLPFRVELCFRDNHYLGVPTEISQHSCDTFWHPLLGPKVAPYQRFALAALGCGSLWPPIKLLIWWVDKAGEYLFPGWKHPSCLWRSLLVVIKWIPNTLWIGHG